MIFFFWEIITGDKFAQNFRNPMNWKTKKLEKKKKNMECIYIYEKNYTISMSKQHTETQSKTYWNKE